MHALKKGYDTPRKYLNFSGQILDIHPCSASPNLQTSTVLKSSNTDISGMGGSDDFMLA